MINFGKEIILFNYLLADLIVINIIFLGRDKDLELKFIVCFIDTFQRTAPAKSSCSISCFVKRLRKCMSTQRIFFLLLLKYSLRKYAFCDNFYISTLRFWGCDLCHNYIEIFYFNFELHASYHNEIYECLVIAIITKNGLIYSYYKIYGLHPILSFADLRILRFMSVHTYVVCRYKEY